MSKETAWEKDWEDSKDAEEESGHAPAESKTAERGGARGAKESVPDDDAIVSALQKYFFEDEALAEHFETFIDRHAHVIDLDSDEYKLQYTEVFDEYKRHFEDRMEGFIQNTLRCSIQDVYLALKRKTESDENSCDAFFAQVLVAVTDFDVFMMMMRESAAKLREQSAHK